MNDIQDKRILIIDDDQEICELLRGVLAKAGAETCCAYDGRQGLARCQAFRPHLILLDIMMPDIDGLQLCTSILATRYVPIIFLSALGQDRDVIAGLERGAVDYVTKPFSFPVLLARIGAALRHAALIPGAEPDVYYGDDHLTIDACARQVVIDGERVELTPTEWQLLLCLCQNADRPVPYEEILHQVWGPEYADSLDYVHVHMSRLRSKLEHDPRRPRYLHNERGWGYRFATIAERQP